jgi:hypothetical protein
LLGTYTVAADQSSADLSVTSFSSGTVTDAAGHVLSTILPASANIANSSNIIIDSVAPTNTFSTASYDAPSNTLTLTGANINTLLSVGETSSTDLKDNFDWAQFQWDIDSDDTENILGTAGMIDSVFASDDSTLTIKLNSYAAIAIEATTGFDALMGNDSIEIIAGFSSDSVGNKATTDVLDGPNIVPTVLAFSSTVSDGFYKAGDEINITATIDEKVISGMSFDVTLNTGAVVTLTAAADGTSLLGTYTVAADHSSTDLSVTSFTSGTVKDIASNALSTTLPDSANIADSSNIAIDNIAPTNTFSTASYDTASNTLTLTGTNINSLLSTGETSSTDLKDNFDWAQFKWDIDSDNTDNILGTAGMIDSVFASDDSTLTIKLNSYAAIDLEGTTGFDALMDNDSIEITAGFSSDSAGNKATTDAFDNEPVAVEVVFRLDGSGDTTDNGTNAFAAGTAYNISIYTAASDSVASNSTQWTGGANLDGDDTLTFLGDNAADTDYSDGKLNWVSMVSMPRPPAGSMLVPVPHSLTFWTGGAGSAGWII